MTTAHYRPSTADAAQLGDVLSSTPAGLLAESGDDGNAQYLNELIAKPWGHEFRIYADDLYDVWKLCLRPGESTSVHCHPRKETALLCLGGRARMDLLDRSVAIEPGDASYIGKGVFHGTANVGSDDLHVVEVELPRNKLDLVRLTDRYGRAGARYENSPRAAASELRPGQLIRRSRVRAGVAIEGFTYGIQAGLDLISRPVPDLLYAVALSVTAALEHRIDVLTPADIADRAEHEQLYLSIAGQPSPIDHPPLDHPPLDHLPIDNLPVDPNAQTRQSAPSTKTEE
jgi:mannose-6-phosphate isomerase-like protein (cupin superfamily)